MKKQIINIYQQLIKMYGHQQDWWPGETPFHIAMGAILTQNTSWNSAYKALQNLIQNKLDTPEKILNVPIDKLRSLIKPAGFMNCKAIYLKNLASFICENLDCCILNLAKQTNPRKMLLSVKGIGKETADSILLYAINLPYFVIDAYTIRLFSRLGLIKGKVSYDDLALLITSQIPQDINLYKEFHALIVEHAKKRCKKQNPMCNSCLLKDLCLR